MKTLRKDCASGFSWSRMSEGKRKQLRSRAGEDVQSQTVKSLRDFAKILAFSPSGMVNTGKVADWGRETSRF